MAACPSVHSPTEASPSCLSQILPACELENMCVPALFRSGVLRVATSVLAAWGPRSRAWGIPLLLLLPLLLGGPGSGAAAVTLFPHGASQGDSSLPRSVEARSPRIVLPDSFTLVDRQFSSVFIYDDGWITLNDSAAYGDFDYYDNLDFPCICVYCAYVDLTLGGNVTYRKVPNPNLTSFSDVLPPNFSPAWALVATWFDVRSQAAPDKANTYQALMTSDGSRSVLLLLYDNVTWYQDRSSSHSFAWAGYTTGSGVFVALNTSKTTRILDLETQSNIGKPGLFVFRLSTDPETSTTASSTAASITTASSTAASTTTASSTAATTTTASSTAASITTASSTAASTTTVSSTAASTTTASSTAASTTTSTTTVSSTAASTTTASSTAASTTTASSTAASTTTASSTVDTTTTASSTVDTTTTASSTAASTTTASSTVDTTTASSSVSTTTMPSSVDTTTASSTVDTTTASSTVDTTTASSTVDTNTESSSGSGESRVGLLLTAHFIAVVITGTLILLVSIALVVISWNRCFPKAKRKLDARVSPVISV